MRNNGRLLKKLAGVYNFLDGRIRKNSDAAGNCRACGQCCDFEGYDHRLFVTTPELIYLAAKLPAGNLKKQTGSRCPYNIDGKCSVYENRFAGCRIFCCKGDADWQSRLSEEALGKFKKICEEFQIQYYYTDLATALKSFTC
ncbi:MAG: YkgJ family cysteine cluster protein [Planctomycetota bacterium]|jgi:Fe-S-cluster containining protein